MTVRLYSRAKVVRLSTTLYALYASRPKSDDRKLENQASEIGGRIPLVGSSRNRIEGLVTSSHAIDTRRFSPPEIERRP